MAIAATVAAAEASFIGNLLLRATTAPRSLFLREHFRRRMIDFQPLASGVITLAQIDRLRR
jgi:hypothetical protein